MEIYYLCLHGEKPFRPLSNPTGGSRIVRPESNAPKAWAKARQKAVEHCAGLPGARYCMIVVGHVDIRFVMRRDWKIHKNLCIPCEPDDRHDHHLVTYTERLLSQYAAMVLVPPMGAVKQLPYPWTEHTPTLPMVAAYRVEAAMSVNLADFSTGFELSSKGYRVLTLGDFAYMQHGPTVYDEFGTTKKWKRAYERTIEELLGVCSRD